MRIIWSQVAITFPQELSAHECGFHHNAPLGFMIPKDWRRIYHKWAAPMAAKNATVISMRREETTHNHAAVCRRHPCGNIREIDSSGVSYRRCNHRREMPRLNRSECDHGKNNNYKCPAYAHNHTTDFIQKSSRRQMSCSWMVATGHRPHPNTSLSLVDGLSG